MKTFLIVLDGAKGTGKSTVSLLLQNKLNKTAFIGFDSVRHLIVNAKASNKNNKIVFDVIISMLNSFLEHDVNVVIDGGLTEERLKIIQKIVQKNNSNLYLYHLWAPREVLWERIQGRAQCKKPDRERFDYVYDILNKKNLAEFKEVDTVQNNPETIVEKIYKDAVQ